MPQAEQLLSKNPYIVDALGQIWRRQWDVLRAQREGASIGHNVECLHRLRVALRQTRALLKIFAPILPDRAVSHFVADFKWLAAATSPVRDLDVQLADILSWSAGQGARSEGELAAVVAELSRERATAQKRLQRALASKRYTSLAERWLHFLAALPYRAQLPQEASSPARAMAALMLAKQCLKLLKDGFAAKSMPTPQDLHRLRIRGKRVRYLLDNFAPLLGHSKRCRHLCKALRSLQHELGVYRDSDLASLLATRLLEGGQSTTASNFLRAWRGDLELRKRLSRDRYKVAFATFANACRSLPS